MAARPLIAMSRLAIVGGSIILTAGCGSDAAPSMPTGDSTSTFAALGGDPAAAAALVLLAPVDMFTAGFLGGEASPTPMPCGGDADATGPPLANTGTFLANTRRDLAVQQEIRVYSTPDVAASAYAAIVGGYTCATSISGGLSLTTPGDVTADVSGAAAATLIGVTTADTEGAAVIVRYQDSVSTYLFVAPPGAAEAASAPSPVEVAATGTNKIIVGLTPAG